jgi:glutaredoxin
VTRSGRLHAVVSLVVCLLSVALAVGGLPACKRSQAAIGADPDSVPILVTEASGGLLLTWIDDKGDFHVETSVADVPMMGRDTVRVVDPNKEDGTHADRIFVADLRTARPDGSFPVRTMTRAEFEALAVARREKTGPTLASAAPPSPSAPAPTATDVAPGATPSNVRPTVIIYGAEWCGACHDAAKYLKSKGVPFIEKDVEKDPSASREMQDKLAKNGLHGGSIPVIDVRGKVMVGFNPHEIDGALGAAL